MDAATLGSFAPLNFVGDSWQAIGILNWMATYLGISTPFPSFISNPLIWDTVKLLVLGSVLSTGRKWFWWLINRLKIRRHISAEFKANDPTYHWVVAFMRDEKVWHTPREYIVEMKSSQRKWKVENQDVGDGQVDYIPLYDSVQFFRWRGHLFEIAQNQPHQVQRNDYDDGFDDVPVLPGNGHLYLTIHTRKVSVLFSFVEECRLKYAETTKPHVIVHSVGGSHRRGYGGDRTWGSAKTKHRRPLDSLLLDGNKIESLLADAREFLKIEDWYIQAGIPHRRGYLLHGPPGTGKTSTVYTVAGELGLEIYSLSLSSVGMDDDQLSISVSRIPPGGVLLIEDIDCAFPTREDEDNENEPLQFGSSRFPRSQITLSGLLNMLDGIGSEEGRLFFATTNHIDRLDPALLRPGRIDRKIEYKLASRQQTRALFARFFPAARFRMRSDVPGPDESTHFRIQYVSNTEELADKFARAVPEHEFSIAELQGYLLEWKLKPLDALLGVEHWVEEEHTMRRERAARERSRKERIVAAKAKEQVQLSSAVIAGIGNAMAHGDMYGQPHAPGPFSPVSESPKLKAGPPISTRRKKLRRSESK